MNEPIKVLKEIENWDVLDENRQLTGRIHPRGTPMAKGEFHQVVHICIFHGGKLLVQLGHFGSRLCIGGGNQPSDGRAGNFRGNRDFAFAGRKAPLDDDGV